MVPTVQKTMETPQSQCIDEMIDVPVVSVVQVPRACVVKKTVENPQFQTVEKSAEDPQAQTIQGTQTPESSGNASFHQAAQAAPRVQKIVEMPKVQFSDGEVDMPVVTQSQVPMISNVQKTVEVPQIQYVDKIVDAPVVAWTEDVSVGTQTVSRKRKLSMETESADGTSEEEHDLVQEEECKLVVDETRERHAAGDDPDLLPVAPNMEAGGSHLQATAEEERIVDWTQDLREIRRMVEFLVRRERKLDVKADVAVKRLARLEKEHSQLEDEEREASLPDALADRTKVVKIVVDKWFVDKGFGFGRVPTGEVIFIHASVVRGAEVLMIGTDAWVQVVRDDARAQGVSSMQSMGTRRVERGERQREGKQSGRASEASSGVDGRVGSSVGERSLRGVQPSSGLARRGVRCHTAAHLQPLSCHQQLSPDKPGFPQLLRKVP